MAGSTITSPAVAFIIVNYNGVQLLQDCLDAIIAQDYDNSQIILVDNGSDDGSASFVRGGYPQVKLIALPENRGFAGGNIEGYRHASADFIATINTDACIAPKWLNNMLEVMEGDGNVGICGSKLIVGRTDRIDSVGDYLTTAFHVVRPGENEPETNYTKRKQIFGACAAAAFYRDQMIKEIGFFDEEFFLNHEDTDLNLRALLAGWKCMLVPEAVAWHQVSASLGELSESYVYYHARNSLWVPAKNLPFSLLLRYFPQRMLYEICAMWHFCVILRMKAPYSRGKLDSLRYLPRIIGKKKRYVIPTSELKNRLVPLSWFFKKYFHKKKRKNPQLPPSL